MDAETSAMVEALYASGKVERPNGVNLYTTIDGKPCFPNDPGMERGAWRMVLALAERGWHLHRGPTQWLVMDGDDIRASEDGPILAMVAALNGGW